jgi:dTDP-4-dehydrorhamnose reductase
LITGVNGQLGTELSHCIVSGKTALGLQVKDLMCKGVSSAELDVRITGAVNQYITENRFDVVINCASKTNVDTCETETDQTFAVNALGARNLAIACNRHNIKLVHLSTDYVFDGECDYAYREWDFTNPVNIYGKSKKLSEEYVKTLCQKHFIIRTSWLYGSSGSNFVNSILRLAREKRELKVVNDQYGTPTHTAELAHHILKLLPTEEYGIYHASGNGVCSRYAFACKVIELAGVSAVVTPCSTREFPLPAVRPRFSALDNMMLRNTVGDAFHVWDEALQNFLRNNEV